MHCAFRQLASLALTLLALAACGRPEPWRQEAYVFGTRVEILLQSADEAAAHAAMAEVLREFERLHRSYHAWQPSELTALNAAIAAGRPLDVSAELAGLITVAQEVAAAGDMLFDPGIGKLVGLWGFQQDELPSRLPDTQVLAAVLAQHPSIADLRVTGTTVTSRNRSVALDFGGYLKGIALDHAARLLGARGIDHALINIGGNIIAMGNRDGQREGSPWRIGIQHPRAATVGGLPLASLDLLDGEALGTSGDYHRYFEIGGKRYCHLIDPRSGRPASGTQALTVLIPPGPAAGMRSDALSKPLFIAADGWREMARQLDVAAVLKVGADGTAQLTPAMKRRLTFSASDMRVELRE